MYRLSRVLWLQRLTHPPPNRSISPGGSVDASNCLLSVGVIRDNFSLVHPWNSRENRGMEVVSESFSAKQREWEFSTLYLLSFWAWFSFNHTVARRGILSTNQRKLIHQKSITFDTTQKRHSNTNMSVGAGVKRVMDLTSFDTQISNSPAAADPWLQWHLLWH